MVVRANVYLELLFLRRALPLTKEELGEEYDLSRTSKGNVSNQTKVHLKQLQDKTTEYARKTRRSVDLDKIRKKRDKFKTKLKISLILKKMIFQIGCVSQNG